MSDVLVEVMEDGGSVVEVVADTDVVLVEVIEAGPQGPPGPQGEPGPAGPGGGTAVEAASTTVAGIVELATNAEALAGTDAARAVTPAALEAVLVEERTSANGTYATSAALTSASTADRQRANHTGTQSLDTTTDSATRLAMTAAERTKLTGVASGATANATDAQLRDRATHTGSQTSATISDFTEAAQDAVAALLVQGTGVTLSYNDAGNTLTVTSTGSGGVTDPEVVRDTIGTALVGVGVVSVAVNDAADTITISTTATANSTDAALRDRSTHTGAQAISTVTGLQTALDGKVDDGDLTTHAADTTAVHGIADTSLLLTTTAAPELIRDTMSTALVAGTNVTITPNDAGDTITIASTASGIGGSTVAPPSIIPVGSDYRLFPGVAVRDFGAAAPTVERINYAPIFLHEPAIFTGIGIHVTAAGGAGALARLGIYSVNSNLTISSRVLDAGTVSVATTGVKDIAVGFTLPAGFYFTALVADGSPGQYQSVRGSDFAQWFFPSASDPMLYGLNNGSYIVPATALPATPGVFQGAANVSYLLQFVHLRKAS